MIYILVPVYNEEKNIENLFNELSEFVANKEVCFVFSDDGSVDQTIPLIMSFFADPFILGDGVNKGPGSAFNRGFEWIIENSESDADVVVTIEADCTSDLGILNGMLALHSQGFDLILASVYAQGGGFDSSNWFRRFISLCANLLFRFFFNVKVQTVSSFYRVYGVALLRKIKLTHREIISEAGFICMLEILLKSIDVGARIREVPTILKSKKRVGDSKMNIFVTTLQYFSFLARHKLQFRSDRLSH